MIEFQDIFHASSQGNIFLIQVAGRARVQQLHNSNFMAGKKNSGLAKEPTNIDILYSFNLYFNERKKLNTHHWPSRARIKTSAGCMLCRLKKWGLHICIKKLDQKVKVQ